MEIDEVVILLTMTLIGSYICMYFFNLCSKVQEVISAKCLETYRKLIERELENLRKGEAFIVKIYIPRNVHIMIKQRSIVLMTSSKETEITLTEGVSAEVRGCSLILIRKC